MMAALIGAASVSGLAYGRPPKRHAMITATAGRLCPPRRHGRVLKKDRKAVVYEAEFGYGSTDIFGCAGARGASYVLGPPAEFSSQGGGGVQRVTLGGAMVAYENSSVGRGSGAGDFLVVVRNLANGRLVHKEPTGTRRRPQSEGIGVGPPTAIVVASNGSVAWIAENREATYEAGNLYFEVHARDRSGSRLLAAGTDLSPKSLRLVGNTLSWTQGGARRQALLR